MEWGDEVSEFHAIWKMAKEWGNEVSEIRANQRLAKEKECIGKRFERMSGLNIGMCIRNIGITLNRDDIRSTADIMKLSEKKWVIFK